MLLTLKLLSKIHICLIGILWGADFLCRHTAKLCSKGNFCAPYRSAPPAGYSCLRQRDPSDVAPLPRRQPTRAQGASPAGFARGLRCFAPQGCRLSLAGPLHLPPFGVKWPPPRQSPPQKSSARQTCRAPKNQLFNPEISCRIAIANIHYQIAKLLFVIGIFAVFNPCSDEVAKNTSEVFVSCI